MVRRGADLGLKVKVTDSLEIKGFNRDTAHIFTLANNMISEAGEKHQKSAFSKVRIINVWQYMKDEQWTKFDQGLVKSHFICFLIQYINDIFFDSGIPDDIGYNAMPISMFGHLGL